MPSSSRMRKLKQYQLARKSLKNSNRRKIRRVLKRTRRVWTITSKLSLPLRRALTTKSSNSQQGSKISRQKTPSSKLTTRRNWRNLTINSTLSKKMAQKKSLTLSKNQPISCKKT